VSKLGPERSRSIFLRHQLGGVVYERDDTLQDVYFPVTCFVSLLRMV
jgi:hypothetical protein